MFALFEENMFGFWIIEYVGNAFVDFLRYFLRFTFPTFLFSFLCFFTSSFLNPNVQIVFHIFPPEIKFFNLFPHFISLFQFCENENTLLILPNVLIKFFEFKRKICKFKTLCAYRRFRISIQNEMKL